MTKNELVSAWGNAADSGSLLTAKHDPNNLSIAWPKYRTVLSHDLASKLVLLGQLLGVGQDLADQPGDAADSGGLGDLGDEGLRLTKIFNDEDKKFAEAAALAWRAAAAPDPRKPPQGLALGWWLQQLESAATRRALLERHTGLPTAVD